MQRYTKSQKGKLRELAGIANERELDQELEKLYRHFESWKKKEISCFELSDLIHTFHQEPSREIWKMYTFSDPDMAVSRAVALGLLKQGRDTGEPAGYFGFEDWVFYRS